MVTQTIVNHLLQLWQKDPHQKSWNLSTEPFSVEDRRPTETRRPVPRPCRCFLPSLRPEPPSNGTDEVDEMWRCLFRGEEDALKFLVRRKKTHVHAKGELFSLEIGVFVIKPYCSEASVGLVSSMSTPHMGRTLLHASLPAGR